MKIDCRRLERIAKCLLRQLELGFAHLIMVRSCHQFRRQYCLPFSDDDGLPVHIKYK